MNCADFGANGRLVLGLRNLHKLAEKDTEFTHVFLEIIEYAARQQLLVGTRLIALVHTDGASFRADCLGARSAGWNEREWLNNARGFS